MRLGKECGGYDLSGAPGELDPLFGSSSSSSSSSSGSSSGSSTSRTTSTNSSISTLHLHAQPPGRSWEGYAITASGLELDHTDRWILEYMRAVDCRQFAPWLPRPGSLYSTFIPLAMADVGVMHALLSVFGSHAQPGRADEIFAARVARHHEQALHYVNRHWSSGYHCCDPEQPPDDAFAARILLLCLKSSIVGSRPTIYQYPVPWQLLVHIASRCPRARLAPAASELQSFIRDFCSFHGLGCALSPSLVKSPPKGMAFPSFMPEGTGLYFGCAESLFMLLSVSIPRARSRTTRH